MTKTIKIGDRVSATKGSLTFKGEVTRIYKGFWANSDGSESVIVELRVPGERVPGFALLKNCRKS